MRLKRMSLFAAIVALVLIAASAAWAHKSEEHAEARREHMRERLMNAIPDLTEEQAEQMQALRQEGHKEMKALRVATQKLHRELREMVREGADEKQTDAKIDEIVAAKASVMKRHVAQQRELAEILDEDQLAVARRLMHRRKKGGKGRQHQRGGGGGGHRR